MPFRKFRNLIFLEYLEIFKLLIKTTNNYSSSFLIINNLHNWFLKCMNFLNYFHIKWLIFLAIRIFFLLTNIKEADNVSVGKNRIKKFLIFIMIKSSKSKAFKIFIKFFKSTNHTCFRLFKVRQHFIVYIYYDIVQPWNELLMDNR